MKKNSRILSSRLAIPAVIGGVSSAYKAYKALSACRKKVQSSVKSKGSVVSNQTPSGKLRRKRTTQRKPVVKSVRKQIRELRKTAESDMGKLTFRQRNTGRVLAAVNAQGYLSLGVFHTSFIESVLAQLRYYDPAAPSALVQASGATGTYQKDFQFDPLYVRITLRNNYQSPCVVTVYSCKVVDDTSITSLEAYENGLADVGGPTASSPLVYCTDSQQFIDLWKPVKTTKSVLQPGEELIVNHSTKGFQYDPSLVDSHPSSYQTRYMGFEFFIRVEGVIAHDSSADEQGTIAGGVDYLMDRVCKVRYSAGADIEYVYITNGSDAFTNGALVSQKPVADNLAYSVS